ncbi:MAG: hypothetical protein RIR48_3178, partial [Bacteroidota bacterium]
QKDIAIIIVENKNKPPKIESDQIKDDQFEWKV